jgi:hypothetical protein
MLDRADKGLRLNLAAGNCYCGFMPTWSVKTITVEARSIGRDPDTLTLACESIETVPALHQEQEGEDGTIMTSEIEPLSLLVRGTDLKALDTIESPTHLFFKDARTGESKEFRVSRGHTEESNTAKFVVGH